MEEFGESRANYSSNLLRHCMGWLGIKETDPDKYRISILKYIRHNWGYGDLLDELVDNKTGQDADEEIASSQNSARVITDLAEVLKEARQVPHVYDNLFNCAPLIKLCMNNTSADVCLGSNIGNLQRLVDMVTCRAHFLHFLSLLNLHTLEIHLRISDLENIRKEGMILSDKIIRFINCARATETSLKDTRYICEDYEPFAEILINNRYNLDLIGGEMYSLRATFYISQKGDNIDESSQIALYEYDGYFTKKEIEDINTTISINEICSVLKMCSELELPIYLNEKVIHLDHRSRLKSARN